MWAQGRAEWQPLHAVPELAVASSSAAAGAATAAGAAGSAAREAGNAVDSAGGAAAQQAAAARPVGSRAKAAAAPAVVSAAAAKRDDPMAAFTAEISAIEAVSSQQRGRRIMHAACGKVCTDILSPCSASQQIHAEMHGIDRRTRRRSSRRHLRRSPSWTTMAQLISGTR